MPEQCQGSYVCIVNVNNNLSIGKIPNKILYIGSTNDTDCNLLTKHFVLAKGKNFPTGDGFWYVQTIGYEIKPDGTVRTGKQIAYQYTGTKLFARDCYNDVWDRWAEYTTKSDLGDLITHRKTTGNTSDSGNITINRPEGYSLIGAYINSVYVRLSIPTVYQKTIIVRCFDENMSPLKNTLVEVISLWIKKDISY